MKVWYESKARNAGNAEWHGRCASPNWPDFTRAAAWNAWNSRSLYPTYDVADDKREFAERDGRMWRLLGWSAFFLFLALLVWKPALDRMFG